MKRPDFDFDDPKSNAPDVAGTPEGDGDFETDNLPDTGETSAGGQVPPARDPGAKHDSDRHEATGLEKLIDKISHGTLLP